jgi:hypothetical protein
VIDAQVDLAAVSLKLRLARSARSDAAAQLRHRLAPPRQTRQLILKLCQLHLKLALPGPRVTRKDIQNQLRSVDDTTRQLRLQIAQLRRRQIMVEENEIRSGGGDHAFDLLQLSLPNQRCRIGPWPPLN